MTNAQIIFNNSLTLMEQGIIKGTGQMMKAIIINKDGKEEEKLVEIPEEIHTYAAWKNLGYQVKRGEKAKAQFTIWKHVSKKEEMEVKYTDGTTGIEEVDASKMFMKLSSFFSASQVEAIAN
jgi:alpha-glucuronidase